MITRRQLFLGLLLHATTALFAQREPAVKPSFKGSLLIPVITGPEILKSYTLQVGRLEGVVQAPLYKGLGIGVGYNASWSSLKQGALAPTITEGDALRTTWFGKVQYERHTSARTFYELNARFGSSTYEWTCATCPEGGKQQGFHWGVAVAYYLLATDNLGFGLLMGFESDQVQLSPEVFGLERYPRRSDNSPKGPYDYLTFGLGFHMRFARSSERDVPF